MNQPTSAPVVQTNPIEAWPINFIGGANEVLARTKQKDPQLFNMTEEDLLEELKLKKQTPGSTICMLRLRFWDEYKRAEGGQMFAINIYRDVCTENTWNKLTNDPYALAWILNPLQSIIDLRNERLDALMRTLRPVATESVYGEDGKLDIKVARLKFEMLMYFDQMRSGAPIQRSETKTFNISTTIPANSATEAKILDIANSMTDDEIKNELARMEKEEHRTIEVKVE